MVTVILLVILVGFAGAATVYYVGGGQVSNLTDPTAASDAATKGYVDTVKVGGCVPRYDYQGTSGNSGVFTACTSCSGFVTQAILTDDYADQSYGFLIMDGVTSNNLTMQVGEVTRGFFFIGRFESSLQYQINDLGSGATYMQLHWCEDI